MICDFASFFVAIATNPCWLSIILWFIIIFNQNRVSAAAELTELQKFCQDCCGICRFVSLFEKVLRTDRYCSRADRTSKVLSRLLRYMSVRFTFWKKFYEPTDTAAELTELQKFCQDCCGICRFVSFFEKVFRTDRYCSRADGTFEVPPRLLRYMSVHFLLRTDRYCSRADRTSKVQTRLLR